MDERYDHLKEDLLDLLQCFKQDLINMERKEEGNDNKSPKVAKKLEDIRNQLHDFFDDPENQNVKEESNSNNSFF